MYLWVISANLFVLDPHHSCFYGQKQEIQIVYPALHHNQIHIFSLLYFVNTPPMERINKATFLGDLLFSERKGRNLLKPLAAWC